MAGALVGAYHRLRGSSRVRTARGMMATFVLFMAALLAAQGPKSVDAGQESCFNHPGLQGVAIPIKITEKCRENLRWMVNIVNPVTLNHVGSGVLVESDLVVTTATCLAQFGTGEYPKVIIGTYDVNGKGGDNPEMLNTCEVIVHSGFDGAARTGPDLALLKLSRKSRHSAIEAYLPMANCGNGDLNFVGWFISQWGGAVQDTLSCAPNMRPVDQRECAEVLNGLYEGSVCTKNSGRGIENAVGTANPVFDYGGPLLCEDSKLVGLASKTELIGGVYYPTSFVEVTKFKNWIDSHGEGESKTSVNEKCKDEL